MYRHLLVPVDATDLSAELVASAVDFAGSVSARITFFHASRDYADLLPGRDEAMRAASVDDDADVHASRVRELLAKAEGAAHASGVPCASMQACNEVPARAIVAAAQGRGCDLVLMTSHGSSKHAAALSSETVDALLHAGIPVLLYACGVLQPPARAISIIRDEHRSLSAVLHAGMHALAMARLRDAVPDPTLMHALVGYLERVRVAQHHPREEHHLFKRLRARTSAFDAEIDELQRQHERDRELVAHVAGHVEAVSSAADRQARASAVRALEVAVTHYAAFIWEHLGREEGVILPAARRYLTVADWADIDAAFSGDANPRIGGPVNTRSQQLVSRILELSRSLDEPIPSS